MEQTEAKMDAVENADHFTGALPDRHFRIVLTNAAGQTAGLVFSVFEYEQKIIDTFHTYGFAVYPYYHDEKAKHPNIVITLKLVDDPKSLFESAASDAGYSIELSSEYVKELLVVSFMHNNASVLKTLKAGGDYKYYEGRTTTKAEIVYYPKYGWMYSAKYGEGRINGNTHSLKTVTDVANFVKLIGSASPPPAAWWMSALTMERLVDAALL
jgi:hypothetical protein